jgi:TetR/AcrR family transcriptional regulator, tetracycline repressor protein
MSPTERPGLDRDEVVRVALQLLDEVGLDGLTMRSLAERLGVRAASLYWHLRDKDELADLLVEAINAELPDPTPGLPWRQQLEEQAWAWRQVLLRHRDAARLAMGRFVVRPVTLRRIEMVLATLRQAGLTPEDTANAAYLVSNFVPGFVAEETAPRPAARPEATNSSHVSGIAIKEPRLEVGSASRLTIRADPTIPDLYLAHSEGQLPEIYAADGVVNLLHTRGRKPSTLLLNASVPWEIAVRRGAAQVSADLRGLSLRAFEVQGGASRLELTLPQPSGTVPIRLRGGASKLTIHRPADVPVRAEIRGGISKLTFDHQPFRAAGELTVQSPGFERSPARYDISLQGGASRLIIDTATPAETPSAAVGTSENEGPQSLAELSPAEYPTLAALAGQIMNPSMDDRFRFGLRVLLDGLEQRIKKDSAH